MDQQGLALDEPAMVEHVDPDREVVLRQGRRLDHGQARRHRQGLGLGRGHVGRVAAARHQGTDPVADGEPSCAFAQGDDLARDFETRQVRGAGGRRVSARTLEHVRPIDSSGRDLIRISPDLGFGTGRSSAFSTSGPPGVEIAMADIVSGIGMRRLS